MTLQHPNETFYSFLNSRRNIFKLVRDRFSSFDFFRTRKRIFLTRQLRVATQAKGGRRRRRRRRRHRLRPCYVISNWQHGIKNSNFCAVASFK